MLQCIGIVDLYYVLYQIAIIHLSIHHNDSQGENNISVEIK